MTDYRWLTNLRTPLDAVDERFIEALGDTRIGVPVETPASMPIDWMREQGIQGLYATIEAVNSPLARKLSGWGQITPERWAKAPLFIEGAAT